MKKASFVLALGLLLGSVPAFAGLIEKRWMCNWNGTDCGDGFAGVGAPKPEKHPYTSDYDVYVYAPAPAPAPRRGQLLVFLRGTGGKPQGFTDFYEHAAHAGYHVIGLDWWDNWKKGGTKEAPEPPVDPHGLTEDPDPNGGDPVEMCGCATDCYGRTHRLIWKGKRDYALPKMRRWNSVEHRLVKVLEYMALHHSADPAWGEYLVLKFGRNRPNYKVIVMAGHSQGGAHAGYIASQQTLAGLLAFSSPFPETIDHDPNVPSIFPQACDRPGSGAGAAAADWSTAWIRDNDFDGNTGTHWLTPRDRMLALIGRNDTVICNPQEHPLDPPGPFQCNNGTDRCGDSACLSLTDNYSAHLVGLNTVGFDIVDGDAGTGGFPMTLPKGLGITLTAVCGGGHNDLVNNGQCTTGAADVATRDAIWDYMLGHIPSTPAVP